MNLYSSIFESYYESEKYFINNLLRKKPSNFSDEEFLERCCEKILSLKSVFYHSLTIKENKLDTIIKSKIKEITSSNHIEIADDIENFKVQKNELNIYNITIRYKETQEIDPEDRFSNTINYGIVLNIIAQFEKKLNPKKNISLIINEDKSLNSIKFTNNFNHLTPEEVKKYFYENLVERKLITLEVLNLYLISAFDNQSPPIKKFKITFNTVEKVIKIFHLFYKNESSKPFGKRLNYVKLLGEYFEGFTTKKVSNNFTNYN